MHVDEDLTQLAVIVFAGVEIDLVAAHRGLLDVALPAIGQLAPGGRALDLDASLDDPLLRLRGRGRSCGSHRGRGAQPLALQQASADPGLQDDAAGVSQALQDGIEGFGFDLEHHHGRCGQQGGEGCGHGDRVCDGDLGARRQGCRLGLGQAREIGQPTRAGDGGVAEGDLLGAEAHALQEIEGRVGQLGLGQAQDIGQEAGVDHPDRKGVRKTGGHGKGRLDGGDLVAGEAAGLKGGPIDPGGAREVPQAKGVQSGVCDIDPETIKGPQRGTGKGAVAFNVGGLDGHHRTRGGGTGGIGSAQPEGEFRVAEEGQPHVQALGNGAPGLLEQAPRCLPRGLGAIGEALGQQPVAQPAQADQARTPGRRESGGEVGDRGLEP